MKTEEFIKKVKSLGFEVEKEDTWINIYFKYNDERGPFKVADVLLNKYKAFWVDYYFCKETGLLNILKEYAKTPVRDREDPKRYYYKYKKEKGRNEYLVTLTDHDGKLGPNWNVRTNKSAYQNKNWVNSFSEEEYEELRKRAIKYGFETILSGDYNINNFEKVEVKE